MKMWNKINSYNIKISGLFQPKQKSPKHGAEKILLWEI